LSVDPHDDLTDSHIGAGAIRRVAGHAKAYVVS